MFIKIGTIQTTCEIDLVNVLHLIISEYCIPEVPFIYEYFGKGCMTFIRFSKMHSTGNITTGRVCCTTNSFVPAPIDVCFKVAILVPSSSEVKPLVDGNVDISRIPYHSQMSHSKSNLNLTHFGSDLHSSWVQGSGLSSTRHDVTDRDGRHRGIQFKPDNKGITIDTVCHV